MIIIKSRYEFSHYTTTGSLYTVNAFAVYGADPEVEATILNTKIKPSKDPISAFAVALVERVPPEVGHVSLAVFGWGITASPSVIVPDIFVLAQSKLLESDKQGLHWVDRKAYTQKVNKLREENV